jgi:hypothetical protein
MSDPVDNGPPPPPGGGAPVLATVRFQVPDPAVAGFAAAGEAVIRALSRQRGYRGARLGRAVDDPSLWVLVSEWAGPGGWRRALSAFEVRCELAPLLVHAVDAPGAFEVLLAQDAADAPIRGWGSDLAPDAATAGPGEPSPPN